MNFYPQKVLLKVEIGIIFLKNNLAVHIKRQNILFPLT